MKYQSTALFKKHLEKSFPNKLDKIYFVVMKDDFDRLKVINNILCYLLKDNVFAVSRFSAENISMKDVITDLDSPSLFDENPIIVLDEVNHYKSKDLQLLVNYIKKNILNGFLILAAKEKKDILTLFSEADKLGVVLDLSAEKRWEKEKRLSAFITEKCAQAKKMITEDARQTLLSFSGLDMSTIENEINKITVYLKDKSLVEKKDVLEICENIDKISAWQIAEKIIWENDFLSLDDYYVDVAFFQMLLTAFRYNMQEGLKLSHAISQGDESLYVSKTLQRRKNQIRGLSDFYFKKALEILLEVEALSREGCNCFLSLINLFSAKLKLLYEYETKISTTA